jgi:hypothetical protein
LLTNDSVQKRVTITTDGDQIVCTVFPSTTSILLVVDVKVRGCPTKLTSPGVALKNGSAKLTISFGI